MSATSPLHHSLSLAAPRRIGWLILLTLTACTKPADPPSKAELAAAPTPAAAQSELSCAPRSTKAQDLDPEWQAFADYIDTCQVTGPTGEVALEMIAVSSPRFYAKLPEGTEIVDMPKPLLRSRDGKLLGRLPYNYPEDPPFGTTLKFSGWENGLPQITVRLQDPTVSGDRDLTPMILNSATGQYEGGNEP